MKDEHQKIDDVLDLRPAPEGPFEPVVWKAMAKGIAEAHGGELVVLHPGQKASLQVEVDGVWRPVKRWLLNWRDVRWNTLAIVGTEGEE